MPPGPSHFTRRGSALLAAVMLTVAASAWLGAAPTPNSPAASGKPRHYFNREWRPAMGGPAGLHYVGAKVCLQCHTTYGAALQTGMGHASDRPARAAILRRHPRLRVALDHDTYSVTRTPSGRYRYSVQRGGQRVAVLLSWAFGLGAAGQTYVYRRHGGYYESRVSFFNKPRALDMTMGYGPRPPDTLWHALGRRLPPDEAKACFVCHTTGSYLGGKFRPQRATSGVSCEECHGPGSAHVAAMRAHDFAGGFHIFNPGQLDANGLVNFCGSCHRTMMTVLAMGVTGTLDVRFQPYRLTLSKCWNPTDSRIACLACHNPHKPLVTQPAAYDHACLACHVVKGENMTAALRKTHPGPACPVATHGCVTCHMPKVHLRGSHDLFTDHDIRIVRPGAPYPG